MQNTGMTRERGMESLVLLLVDQGLDVTHTQSQRNESELHNDPVNLQKPDHSPD